MNRQRKIFIGIIAGALGVFTLLLAVVIIAPKMVDTEMVRDKLRSEIKETSGVEIDFEHLILDFFPHPHVIFEQIQLTQFRPQGLVADLFPDSPIRITDAPANLTIDFNTDESGHLQAELNGSSPSLKFRYAKEALNIKNARLKAAIQVDKNSVSLSLAELALDYPQLTLSANLALTQNTPPLSLQVKGSRIDVAATRQMVLALAGKNDDVKDIFDIVKGGSVPLITLTAQGNSLSDLGNTNIMVIRGQMRNGEISIPDIQFDLKDAAGEVVISRGILKGQNLQATPGEFHRAEWTFEIGPHWRCCALSPGNRSPGGPVTAAPDSQAPGR
ncbi:MAG: AsmA family protein [Deltaproteobacteria bacterium]|nr:AsmA family protein [Deltaproteobacteria bacterium]